jgi:hypothetical protein
MRRSSKALKNWKDRVETWWLFSKVGDFWHELVRRVHRPFWRAKLMYDWYVNVFKDDFDWDSGYLLKIIEYKLKLIKVALENGCAIHEEKDIKALSLAIKILQRMQDEHHSYFEKAHRDHDLKWGELITWTTPNYEANGEIKTYTWHSRRPNANTPEEIEQERLEYRKTWEIEEFLIRRDRRWLFGILSKYMDAWWD